MAPLAGAGEHPYGRHCPVAAGATLRCRAFTLIELLTVIAIVGALTAIMIGVGRRAGESGKIARTKAELAALGAALDSYKRQYGDYPQTGDAATMLQSLIGKLGPKQAAISGRAQIDLALFPTDGAKDPFTAADALLIDPWAQPYVYVYKAGGSDWSNPSFVLYSPGPDGKQDAALLSGGYPTLTAPANADNLYANP